MGTELTADLFAATAEAAGAEPAVIVDGTVTAYAELARLVDAVAARLAARTGGTLGIPLAPDHTDFEALAALLAEQRIERAYFP